MRFRTELRTLCGLIVLSFAPVPEAVATEARFIEEPAIKAAVEKLRQDPELGAETSQRVLKWKSSGEEAKEESPSIFDAWLQDLAEWIARGLQWVATGFRWMVIVVMTIAAAALALYLVRRRRARGASFDSTAMDAPTHVQSLDIRPESLPDDVGAAALALWAAGHHRPALSLLYRGLLSRLVHGHGVNIRSSMTERECVLAAEPALTPERLGYVRRLVSAWQGFVYGGHLPADDDVARLCADFAGSTTR